MNTYKRLCSKKLLFIVKKKQSVNVILPPVKDSHVSTAEKIHADVARVALQRVHANGIEFPILSSSDKVSVAWKTENTKDLQWNVVKVMVKQLK